MKKNLILFILLLTTINLLAKAQLKKSHFNDSSLKKQDNSIVIYQLFPTQNVWTFIKLNTRNGQMWQVQYDIGGKNSFETALNSISLVTSAEEVNGRFTLYPTQNIWNFILLDQIDGNTWQVQWSMEVEERFIIPIK